mmetsp:Transcript_94041/g.242953  ORF Transcript_94041/g.242953 Transcript_94041/m.242953 type:complete len:197 (-) Transcript_94041:41-631(-)
MRSARRRESAPLDVMDYEAMKRLVEGDDYGGSSSTVAAGGGSDSGRRDGETSRRERSRSRRRRRDEPEDPEEAEKRRQDAEEEDERRRLVDESARMDRTIMISGLSLRADERDVFEFFAASVSGKVRDVQIIRDSRTGRSKGVSFVEFSTSEASVKALGLSGQTLKGAMIRVQRSQEGKAGQTNASVSSSLSGYNR